jgi:hypothetical protein
MFIIAIVTKLFDAFCNEITFAVVLVAFFVQSLVITFNDFISSNLFNFTLYSL